MAKIRITNYTFSKSAKQITFSDYATIYLDGILLIVNATRNIIIYNFADPTLGGTVSGNILTLTYDTSGQNDADKLLIYYDEPTQTTALNVKALPAKTVAQINDWTAVAQNTVGKSNVLDCSALSMAVLHIQAFLDTETAHTGTEFIVQTSSNTSGDEDWTDYCNFVGLIGTANSEAITNNPLAANSTTITCSSTTGYTAGAWRAIKDGTLANSELIYQTGLTTNTNITILDGTTNSHAQNTLMYNIAMVQTVILAPTVNRVRLVVNNTYSAAGSTLNYKLRVTEATAL